MLWFYENFDYYSVVSWKTSIIMSQNLISWIIKTNHRQKNYHYQNELKLSRWKFKKNRTKLNFAMKKLNRFTSYALKYLQNRKYTLSHGAWDIRLCTISSIRIAWVIWSMPNKRDSICKFFICIGSLYCACTRVMWHTCVDFTYHVILLWCSYINWAHRLRLCCFLSVNINHFMCKNKKSLKVKKKNTTVWPVHVIKSSDRIHITKYQRIAPREYNFFGYRLFFELSKNVNNRTTMFALRMSKMFKLAHKISSFGKKNTL